MRQPHTQNIRRNAIITSIVLLLVVCVAWRPGASFNGSTTTHAAPHAAPPLQSSSIVWSPSTGTMDIVAGEQNRTASVSLINSGTTTETLTMSTDNQLPTGWTVEVNPSFTSLTMVPGEERAFQVLVSAPATAATGSHTFRLIATSASNVQYQYTLTVNATAATATPTSVPAPSAVVLQVSDDAKEGTPATTVKYNLTIRNPGTGKGRFLIRFPQSCSSGIPGCFESSSLTSVELAATQSQSFEVSVILPSDAQRDAVGSTTVRAELESNSNIAAEVVLTTKVLEASPTPSRTPTPSLTPSITPTPGRICTDMFEDDDERGEAKLIDVDVPQPNPNKRTGDPDDRRAICPSEDEDWLKFGAVGGKVYTIDISEMASGIDLSLELFDEHGRSLAFNDDYFDRNEDPDPDDIKPRIDSWRAPFDGTYYIRVRDAAARGDWDRTYTIEVRTESYGPTPVNVSEVCMDLFEPDGLPEQASLLIYNERQRNRSLCPTGDSDWVTFFAKAGKRYFLYTDTSPYGAKDVNNMQTGADTLIVLTDRDGVSILDYNDDVAGGDTFDSQIEFYPDVDGFYYVQVKNTGDIGNQFLRYDLILELCLMDQTTCGRTGSSEAIDASMPAGGVVEPGLIAQTSGVTPTPTIPDEEFSLDEPTATPTPTPMPTDEVMLNTGAFEPPTPEVQAQSRRPPYVDAANTAVSQAIDVAGRMFWEEWQRSDRAVADGVSERDWVWGPIGLVSRSEAYRQAPGGRRSVQYFDKGRMELNAPDGEISTTWFVTFGLLAQELLYSQIQIGDGEFLPYRPAIVPIFGDGGDASTPTYASFRGVMATPAPDLTGEMAVDTINREGMVGIHEGGVAREVRLVQFVAETQHNIPQVFWDFLNQRDEVYRDGVYRVEPLWEWQRVIGLPLTEPYWVRTELDGVVQDVLVQVYQRRVLAYIPANPPDTQVQMSDIGRHYYQWRYNEPLP